MTKQSRIVRRPDFAGGGITDEEREKMAAHSALWIERALRTESADPAAIEEAIKGLYRAANLAEPRVILVPSPFVMAMAGGIASIWWYLFENKPLTKKRGANRPTATKDETNAATYHAALAETYDATDDATLAETYAATRDATHDATHDVTEDATAAATAAATEDATEDATNAATRSAAYAATIDATDVATRAATNDGIGAVVDESWRALAGSFVGEEWTQAALEAAQRWFHNYLGFAWSATSRRF